MTELFTDLPCKSCGGFHTLHNEGPDQYSATALYSYTCPATGKVVEFKPMIAFNPVSRPPAGSIPMKRVKPGP
jgi:hypothetical protein